MVPTSTRTTAARGPALLVATLTLAVALGGCSNGGGSNAPFSPGGGLPPGTPGWVQGQFLQPDAFAAQCVNPRSGTDPATGLPYTDIQGTVLTENNWLRSWSNRLYLWYDEIIDQNPALYTTLDYFDQLKTFATTPSGAPKDKFHFTVPTDEWQQLSQSGILTGYGASFLLLSAAPPREVVVAFTDPASPAEAANLERGARILTIDGVDVVNANDNASIDTLNAGLFPATIGETHDFTVQDLGGGAPRMISMTSGAVTSDPVQNVQSIDIPAGAGGRVGYLLFNDHIATAEQQLIDAIEQLAADNIDDLVLDVRYNGGGFLAIASELAYMIAGQVPTAGRTFELIEFNDKFPDEDPFTGDPLAPIPFFDEAIGFSATAGQALPTLDLARVFVLTGASTCSASESIINSLRGVGVEVIQIGSTTCGKPYGFYPTDNCGTTYFTIQFRGVNEQGEGDYTDGFSPANSAILGESVPGCSVADDFARELGDVAEARFAAALQYRDDMSCPTPSGLGPPQTATKPGALQPAAEGRLMRPPWREMRTLGR